MLAVCVANEVGGLKYPFTFFRCVMLLLMDKTDNLLSYFRVMRIMPGISQVNLLYISSAKSERHV